MATVLELVTRVQQLTGLRSTGTEATVALSALQNSYRRALLECEGDPEYVEYQFVTSADTYSLSTLLGVSPIRLLHVGLGSSGGKLNLDQVSMPELMDFRQTQQTVGLPCIYATVGFDRISFYPNPNPGDKLQCWYLADTPTLITGLDDLGAPVAPTAGQETTPSKIPVAFHWDVLLSGAVIECLDKDQRAADSQFWMQRYERGIARLNTHIGHMGGQANRAYLPVSGRRPFLRDERTRHSGY